MKENCKDYDVTVPETERGLEPLHAIYSKTCLPVMKEYIDKKDGKEPALSPPKAEKGRVIEFFPQVKVRVVTREEISRIPGGNEAFLNFNTMEEYRKQVDSSQ
ncbi:MAG: hypothetical protein HZA70_05940 [Planctomycetes bacterium]|nr:hypothetical protein [Planctomycetota bacterium]